MVTLWKLGNACARGWGQRRYSRVLQKYAASSPGEKKEDHNKCSDIQTPKRMCKNTWKAWRWGILGDSSRIEAKCTGWGYNCKHSWEGYGKNGHPEVAGCHSPRHANLWSRISVMRICVNTIDGKEQALTAMRKRKYFDGVSIRQRLFTRRVECLKQEDEQSNETQIHFGLLGNKEAETGG